MDLVELDRARAQLARLAALVRSSAAAGAAAGAGGLALLSSTTTLAIPLLVLAVAAGLLALWSEFERRDVVEVLALQAGSRVLPEVRRLEARILEPRSRAGIAKWLMEIPVEARKPGTIYLADRVARNEALFQRLAADLLSPATVAASSLVACLRLLTRAAESPLYNPQLPADELAATLRRISLGIRLEAEIRPR